MITLTSERKLPFVIANELTAKGACLYKLSYPATMTPTLTPQSTRNPYNFLEY